MSIVATFGKMSEQEVGRMVIAAMRQEANAKIEVGAVDHHDAAALAEERTEELLRIEREGRAHLRVKGFLVKGEIAVPALDGGAQSLDLEVPPVLRALYNRARRGLGMDNLSEGTTYRVLMSAHVKMREVANGNALPIALVIDEHERARKLAEAMGLPESDALNLMRKAAGA